MPRQLYGFDHCSKSWWDQRCRNSPEMFQFWFLKQNNCGAIAKWHVTGVSVLRFQVLLSDCSTPFLSYSRLKQVTYVQMIGWCVSNQWQMSGINDHLLMYQRLMIDISETTDHLQVYRQLTIRMSEINDHLQMYWQLMIDDRLSACKMAANDRHVWD